MSAKPMARTDLSHTETREETLERLRTLSPELFEKLYLQPQTPVAGDLRKILGNPTPLGLVGFVVGLTPFACQLMGWRGTGAGPATGAATVGDYWFIGGPLLFLAGIFEFILGNTFTYVVFISYASIFWTLAATFQPFFNAAGAYSATGLDGAEGAVTPQFNASFAFFLIACASLNFLFALCATRINVVYLCIFVGASLGFILAASARWCIALGEHAVAGRLVVGTGASWFVIAMLGWYLLLIQLLSTMNIPVSLPVGDLTHFWDRKPKHVESEA